MPDVTYSAVYSFGDSLSDAGNAYLLTTSKLLTSSLAGELLGEPGQSLGSILGIPPEPLSPPYASESYGSVTADVFSNGPVWSQDLSEALGLGELAPSGIDVTDQEVASAFDVSVSEVDTEIFPLLARLGVLTSFGTYATIANGGNGTGSSTDFAIGGSVTGPTGENSGPEADLTDLAAQYQTFHIMVPTPAASALYTVWSGSNDMLDLLDSGLNATTGASDISQSVTQELDFIQTLIGGGAKNLLVVTVPDLGVTPAGEAEAATASGLAESYDTQLLAGLMPLEQSATITVLDAYGLLDNAVANPGSYDLTNVTDPLWSGNFEGQNGTIAATGTAADGYLFFDEMHPTEQGQMLIADAALTALDGVPCYVRGTRLDTPHGMRRIEMIRAGDRLRTAGGGERPVVWVGHRRLAQPAAAAAWPICFRAGALADGVPRRDLLVSPKHAMFLDGVLVPAELLVNGVSVVRRAPLGDLTYFHVELDRHDIVLAEGAPAESFVDRDSRVLFENFAVLRGGGAPVADCAPRVEDGERLEAVRRRIAARAGLAADHAGDAAAPGTLDGQIDRIDQTAIFGWAFDATRPHSPVRLEVLIDGAVVATCVANSFRVDLHEAGKGCGRCAFTVRLARPPSADHVVQVRRADDGALLAGSGPCVAADPVQPGRLEGFVDVCSATAVEGWALDVDWPGVPVRLEIVDCGQVVETIVANVYRHDLAGAGKAGGWCSFVFRFDAAGRPRDPGRIAVRRASDGAVLTMPAAERMAA